MRSSFLSGILLASALLVVGARDGALPAQGQEQKPTLDKYGDPLPPGAIARLGTLRFVHMGGLTSVAVSPDDKLVASGVNANAKIRLWNAETGKVLREIGTPGDPVTCLLFAADGKSLFAGCGRFMCCLDPTTGKSIWEQEAAKGGTFEGGTKASQIIRVKDKIVSIHRGRIFCEGVNSWGETSYRYHGQKLVRFWNRTTGNPVPLPKALESTTKTEGRIPVLFHDAAVTADATLAAVVVSEADPLPRKKGEWEGKWSYKDRRLQIVQVGTGKIVHSVADPDGLLYHLAFAPDGRSLALTAGKEIWLINTDTGKKRVLTKGLPSVPYQLTFAGGDRLASLFDDDSIRVWNLPTGQSIEKHGIRSSNLAPAIGGKTAATIHGDTVQLVDAETGQSLHAFQRHPRPPSIRYAFYSKGTLISCDRDLVFFWNTHDWKIQSSLVIPPGRLWNWSYNDRLKIDQGVSLEKQLYVKEHEKVLELQSLSTSQLIRPLDKSTNDEYSPYFSAAGNRMFTYMDRCFYFYDVGTGKQLSKIPRSTAQWLGYNCPPALSPLGSFFAQNPDFTEIGIYDVQSGKCLRKLCPNMPGNINNKERSVLGFTFSRDEKSIAGEVHQIIGDGLERAGVSLWDVATGNVLQEFTVVPAFGSHWKQRLHAPKIDLLALSCDNRFVALTGTESNAIEIWEIASGTKRGEFTGHEGKIADLAFSPDGKQLASSSEDTTVLIWDLNRPLQPGSFKKHLDAKELDAYWNALLQADAKKADVAIWSLVSAPKDSVAFLKKQLHPAQAPDKKQVQGLIADLDSGDFQVRSKAQTQLQQFGELALPDLQAALKQPKSVEQKQRLDLLVQKALDESRPFGTAENIRRWRALEVLEKIASAEAKQLVRDLADGVATAQITLAARQVLTRMEKSAAPSP